MASLKHVFAHILLFTHLQFSFSFFSGKGCRFSNMLTYLKSLHDWELFLTVRHLVWFIYKEISGNMSKYEEIQGNIKKHFEDRVTYDEIEVSSLVMFHQIFISWYLLCCVRETWFTCLSLVVKKIFLTLDLNKTHNL